MADPAATRVESSHAQLARQARRVPTAMRMVAALAAVGALCLYVFAARHAMLDFEVYWRAGERALAAEPLYRAEDGHYQFKYFPAFAVLAIPVGALPLEAARVAWFGASFVALCAVLMLCVRLLPDLRKPVWLLVLLTALVMAKFFSRELMLGQVNLFFLVTSLAVLTSLGRGHQVVAGVLGTLAVILKPYGMVLIPWMLAHRSTRLAASIAAGTGAAVLAPAMVYGARGNVLLHQAWWDTVVTTTAPNLLGADNVSWLAMYSRLFGAGAAANMLSAATLAVMAVAFAWMWRMRRQAPTPEVLEGALLLTLTPLISPQGWDYGLLVSAPAVMLVINYHAELPMLLRTFTLAALAAIGLSIYDVVGRENYLRFMNASGLTISYFVVIAALVTLRARRIA